MMDEDMILEDYCERKGVDLEHLTNEQYEQVTKNIRVHVDEFVEATVQDGTFDTEIYSFIKHAEKK